jgi:hypothetical protein
MRLMIPAALAAILASPAAQAGERLCLAPDQAVEAFLRLPDQERSQQLRLGRNLLKLWTEAAATECKAGEVLTIYDPFPGPAAHWPTRTLIARHCDLTKQVVMVGNNTAICYVIQPPRQ